MQALAFFAALLGLTSASIIFPRQTAACNNSPDLCSKSYSSITHLGAHDSPFVRDASTHFSTSGNQYFNSTVQLSAGVRLLSGQVHQSNGGWHLCHSSCDLLDAGPLSDWLREIKTWMDSNPNDVVTVLLVNSDNASPSDLASQFVASGIMSYAYTPPSVNTPPTSWPTLQTLISANTRLMSFVASLNTAEIDSTNSYLMDEFTFIFENPFENLSETNFTCLPDRPSPVQGNIQTAIGSGRMALMNHFLDENELFGIETPDVSNITTTNSPSTSLVGALGASLQSCTTAYGKQPTFVLVDFFDQGPAIAAVDAANGVTNPVGRSSVPSPSDQQSATSGASRPNNNFKAVMDLVNMLHQGAIPTLGAWIWAGGDWTFGGANFNGGNVFQ